MRLLRNLTLLTVILTVSNGEHSHAVNRETLSFILGYTLEEKATCVGVNLCCLRRKVQFKFSLSALFILQFLPRWVFYYFTFPTVFNQLNVPICWSFGVSQQYATSTVIMYKLTFQTQITKKKIWSVFCIFNVVHLTPHVWTVFI